MLKILIVIPVYNHSKTLKRVVEKALEVHPHVLVVDDGSTDSCVETLLGGMDVTLIRHPRNLGKGAAILTGAKKAAALGMTHIVTLDADGQHDPQEFLRFLPLIERNPDAIIVGKRDFDRADVPKNRRFGRSFSNFWLRLQTGQTLGDTQSGFRAYPVFIFNQLRLHGRRYSFEIEILVKAAWAGIKLIDADISVYYPPKQEYVSHFNLFMDNVRLTILNTHLTLRSITPYPHKKIVSQNDSGKKVSVLRPIASIKALLTENMTPAQLSAAGALGVFIGALPLIGIHTISILFATNFLRLNKIVAISASQLCMPPIVPALCIEAGYFMRHGKFLYEISLETIGYQGLERIYEWMLGSLIFAPVLAIGTGSILYIMAWIVKQRLPRKDGQSAAS